MMLVNTNKSLTPLTTIAAAPTRTTRQRLWKTSSPGPWWMSTGAEWAPGSGGGTARTRGSGQTAGTAKKVRMVVTRKKFVPELYLHKISWSDLDQDQKETLRYYQDPSNSNFPCLAMILSPIGVLQGYLFYPTTFSNFPKLLRAIIASVPVLFSW